MTIKEMERLAVVNGVKVYWTNEFDYKRKTFIYVVGKKEDRLNFIIEFDFRKPIFSFVKYKQSRFMITSKLKSLFHKMIRRSLYVFKCK